MLTREYSVEGASVIVKSLERSVISGHPGYPFAMPGDSGAVIFDTDGSPAGMVWGYVDSPCGVGMRCTLYTPMESILASMEEALADEYGRGDFSLTLSA